MASRFCSWNCCQQLLLGGKLINKVGWGVITFFSVILLNAAIFNITESWWAMDFTGNCEPEYYLLMLREGICDVTQSNVRNTANCIAWDDEEKWASIMELIGIDLKREVDEIYPTMLKLTYFLVGLVSLQALICLYQLKFLVESIWLQRIVLGTSLLYWATTGVMAAITSDSKITDTETWEAASPCINENSYPSVSTSVFYTVSTIILPCSIIIVNYPEKIWFLHIIRHDQSLGVNDRNQAPPAGRIIKIPKDIEDANIDCDGVEVELCQHTSIRYGEPPVTAVLDIAPTGELSRTSSIDSIRRVAIEMTAI